MPLRSKIAIFLIISFSQFMLTTCKRSANDVIPTVYVHFSISLNDPQFLDLLSPFTYSYIDKYTNNFGQSAAGYDENGIIVFRSTEDEFYAFDRTCPHDLELNNKSVQVKVTDMIFAVCPECGTKYALTSNGTPYSGVGKYPLKNYRTFFDGLYITVSNY